MDGWTRIALAVVLTALLTWSVQQRAPAQPSPASAFGQGYNQKHFIAAGTDNSTLLRAGNAILIAAQLSGIGSAPAYLKFYDKATAPVCGTDTVVKSLMIPSAPTAANGGGSNTISLGVAFSAGLGYCVVTGIADSDDTAPASATFNINFDYK